MILTSQINSTQVKHNQDCLSKYPVAQRIAQRKITEQQTYEPRTLITSRMSSFSKSSSTSSSCPIDLKSLKNYDECPVRTIGTCDEWRLGEPPNYDAINAKYLLQKSMKHSSDSLEKAVENIVKSWEAEIQHKLIPEQIDSIDQELFSMSTNNQTPWSIHDIVRKGTYCCLLEGTDHPVLNMDFEESNKYFQESFKTGFAWEVEKVFSGPPKVCFSWRHWAHLGTDTLEEEQNGQGKLIELKGFTRANVNKEGKMMDIEVYFDQEKFLNEISA